MNREALSHLDKDQLIELVLLQADQIAQLRSAVASLEARLEELERSWNRGAAPFSKPKDKRGQRPKRPGRKGGHSGLHRKRPPDDAVQRRIDVCLDTCPHCGGALDKASERVVEQTIIEAPLVMPETIRLTTRRNRCRCCGRNVASGHPLQVSTATGAAGTHLGPRALAVAVHLKTGLGLTMRKTCRVLKELLGVALSPGGLAQALQRIAGRMAADHQSLLARIKARPALYTDETSWFVGETGYSLWVLTNDAGTLYRVVASRSKAAALALMGDYQGVLVSDCLNIYDDLTQTQHKCYAHHLKAISQARHRPTARGSPYLSELRGLLLGAMALKAVQSRLCPKAAARRRAALVDNADRLLLPPRLAAHSADAADRAQAECEDKVRRRLKKQRDHLFTFLDHDAVEATNNRAERQLRPAIISRKLSCGNKTMTGARAWEILASAAASCQKNRTSFVDLLTSKIPLNATHQTLR